MMFSRLVVSFVVFFSAIVISSQYAIAKDDFSKQRNQLIAEIKDDVARTAIHLNKQELSPVVLKAMATVPRHEFVPPQQQKFAYQNRPLPIGHGQTISQPYIVAIMTDLLNLEADDKVLEIGTGSGYQAAILAALVKNVFSIEIIKPLGKTAAAKLNDLGFNNVEVKLGDGYYGWDEHAPFDAIIVTAAASHIPPPLIKQLKPGGRMLIPVGSRFMVQELLMLEKNDQGEVTTRQILPVRFVPLTGQH